MELYWKPVVVTKVGVPELLARVLRLHWPTVESAKRIAKATVPNTAESAIAYLQGLRDAGVEGASTLLDAIDEHGVIEIWLE